MQSSILQVASFQVVTTFADCLNFVSLILIQLVSFSPYSLISVLQNFSDSNSVYLFYTLNNKGLCRGAYTGGAGGAAAPPALFEEGQRGQEVP